MDETLRKEIIISYIEAYNNFDIDGMLTHLSEDVKFKNTENGIVTLQTQGIADFKQIASETSKYFSSRKQHILDFDFTEDCAIVYINFEAVVAMDISEKLKEGDGFKLGGKTIFTFENKKISSIEDYS